MVAFSCMDTMCSYNVVSFCSCIGTIELSSHKAISTGISGKWYNLQIYWRSQKINRQYHVISWMFPLILIFSVCYVMSCSNCPVPIPLVTLRDNTFLVALVFFTLLFPCPVLINHLNHSFFPGPTLFYDKHFPSDLGAARGDRVRKMWKTHY